MVALHQDRLAIGDPARQVALADPTRAAAVFKRAMGTDRRYTLGPQSYSAPELSAMILSALKSDAEAFPGIKVQDAVISVPAYFTEMQRKAVRSGGRIAGLNVTRLINEPTAAALAYGLHDRAGKGRFLDFDLGGGTFDVSVLEQFDGVFEVRASAGDVFLVARISPNASRAIWPTNPRWTLTNPICGQPCSNLQSRPNAVCRPKPRSLSPPIWAASPLTSA